MKVTSTRRTHSCKDSMRSQCFSFDDFGIQCKVDFENPARKPKNKILKKGLSDATDLKIEGVHSDVDFQVYLNEKEGEKEAGKVENLSAHAETPETRTPKARWHSFERRLETTKFPAVRKIYELNAAEFVQIKPLTVLQLNNVMNYDTKWITPRSNRISNLFRKIFSVDTYKVLPNSLEYYTHRYGSAFPPLVMYAIEKLGTDGISCPGVFRKSGKKSNINYLEKIAPEEIGNQDLTKYSMFDWADFLKCFLRNLAEPVISPNFTRLFASINDYSEGLQMTICQSLFILMSDENREALYFVLCLLKKIADNSEVNLMNANNLAICFTPSLCTSSMPLPEVSRNTQGNISNIACYKSSLEPGGKSVDVGAVNSAYTNFHKAITFLIENIDDLFQVPPETFQLVKVALYRSSVPMSLSRLGACDNDPDSNYETFMDNNLEQLFEEHKNKFKSWKSEIILGAVPIFSRKIKDNYPLPLYRGYIDLDVACSELFTCYLYKGSLWNGNTERFVIKNLSKKSDLFYQRYTIHNSSSFDRDFTLLRKWKQVNDCYYLSCTSVKITQADVSSTSLLPHQTQKIFSDTTHKRGFVLGSRLIVEPFQGRSRVTLMMRIDLQGKDSRSYRFITPHIISKELNSLKEYFNPINAVIPESQVVV